MRQGRLGPEFAKLWAASAVSSFGDGMAYAAAPLLASSLTHDPRLVAGVDVAFTVPWLLVGLLSGAIVDRVDRRALMWGVDTVRAVLMAVLAASVAGGWVSLPVLYVLFLGLGVAGTFFGNASIAILPSVVAQPDLPSANSRYQATESIGGQLAGPPLGGALFAVAAAVPFAVDAVSFAGSAALVAALRGSFRPPPPAGPRPSLRADIVDGLRRLWAHRLLRTLALMLGVWNLIEMSALSVFVLFAREHLGLGSRGFGLLLGVSAIGGVAGGFAAPAIVRRLGERRALLTAVFAWGIALPITGAMRHAAPVAVLMAISGATGLIWNVVTVSLRQELIPSGLLGRVTSAYRLIGLGTMPLGGLLGGFVAHAYGLRAPFYVGGAVIVVTGLASRRVLTPDAIHAARQERGEDQEVPSGHGE